jgi:ribosomal protein S12 methylthiotransferase accessory factor YcaO
MKLMVSLLSRSSLNFIALNTINTLTALIILRLTIAWVKVASNKYIIKATIKALIKSLTRELERRGILTGWETRTEATLSPFAVERPWNLDVSVKEGRNHWRLSGIQTSYGRGLNIHQARISCLMEVVERYSAFASVESNIALGYRTMSPLVKASYEEILESGVGALNPNELCLEVPYAGQRLSWIKGESIGSRGTENVYVPAQLVFLFANFDEISLTSGISSTGLGAGNTPEEARLSGLLEVIERDAEKVIPFTPQRCFRLEADDPKVSAMLEDLERKGIHIHFLDITPEFGIPCYKAFICGPGGVILKGTGASLDAKRGVLSAMTEIPYPYPYWFGSMEPLEGIPTITYEELPDYSTGDPREDLEIVETVLLKNGYCPIYVDLTKGDLRIPVVRALVPGLEIMTFFDRYTPLGRRQFAHYLRNAGAGPQKAFHQSFPSTRGT